MKLFFYFATICSFLSPLGSSATGAETGKGPIRVLFVGHLAENHRSDLYYPMLQTGLGREAIYFDYVTNTAEAFGDKEFLNRFDAVLLYANHKTIEENEWANLKSFIEEGGGFIPVHCASWCFQNIPEFDQVVGGRFAGHKTGIFRAKTTAHDHAAIKNVPEFEAWDETYFHSNHNEKDRTILQIREVAENDNITKPEPWTWVRTQKKGRVFYTASGHDERVWSQPAFQTLLKKGILWSVGDERLASYTDFIKNRTPLTYEKVDNIPNYEKRPEPLPKQTPLSAAESMTYTRAPIDFDLALFASEPMIVNPIYLAWDERGRLWVAETVDYPNDVRDGKGNDTIKVLEDTDNDGKADKVTVFAEGLNIPTSLVCYNGGIIVAQAPDFLFLKDTDGDDKADLKEVLFTGWGINDTHAGPSNLRYGLDNWIYGTVGYSGFTGEVGGEIHEFKMGVFRFRPDGSEIEFLHQFNNNTWGLGFNAAGDVFGSTANNNPAFHGGVPTTIRGDGAKSLSAEMIADNPTFHPITPNIRQVDVFGGYTAGAGFALATSDNFPESFRDRAAFIGGPTGNLLGTYLLDRKGTGFTATNNYSFLASADEWFSPVAAEVGPDGNLWVADWYNFIIQHNPTPKPERGGYAAVTGKGNAHENPNRDKQHGRIYRTIWKGAKPSAITSLANAEDNQLVAALGNDNLFWRQTAQRILVAGKRKSAAPALKEAIKSGRLAAIHALWTLEGLGELDHDTHQLALLSPDIDLKRNAIRAIPHTDEGVQLFFDTATVTDKEPTVRLAAFIKLALLPENENVKLAAEQLMKAPANREDEWLSTALKAAGAKQGAKGPATFGPNLFPNHSFEELTDEEKPKQWTSKIYKGSAVHAADKAVARTGKSSLRISSGAGADASWLTEIKVEPNTNYRLSGWIKTKGVAGANGGLLNVHGFPARGTEGRTPGLRKNNDWTLVETEFNSGGKTQFTFNALFGGWGTSTGTVWYDDLALQTVEYATVTESTLDLSEGNASRGETIFNTHQVAACIRCHKVDGRGEGVIGPALDGIATRKSSDYIYESLINPGAVMAEGFPAQVSPMPPMGVLLKPQELADVMAYLMTLQE